MRSIADSDTRLERLLADDDGDPIGRVRRLRDEGARFNIGRIQRNFSDPALALQFLDPAFQPRFEFALDRVERLDGVMAHRVRFNERSSPTFVQSEDRDAPASGELWLDPRDGAVLRTQLRLHDNVARLSAMLDVTYRRDARLDLWVPSEMRETYESHRPLVVLQAARLVRLFERIDATARYENFRRFETSGRLVLPQSQTE